jgi:hypothetical protein
VITAEKLAELEQRYMNASPEVKKRSQLDPQGCS